MSAWLFWRLLPSWSCEIFMWLISADCSSSWRRRSAITWSRCAICARKTSRSRPASLTCCCRAALFWLATGVTAVVFAAWVDADLIGGNAQSDEKQNAGRVERPKVTPGCLTDREGDSTRICPGSIPLSSSSIPPRFFFQFQSLEEERLCLFLRPCRIGFGTLWVRRQSRNSLCNDRPVLLHGFLARGTNRQMLL